MKRKSRKSASRRNPKSAKSVVIPLALVAGGAYLLLRNQSSAPVNGMGDLGWGGSIGRSISNAFSSAGGAVSKIVKKVSAPVQSVAKTLVTQAIAAPQVFTAALPLTALTPVGAAVMAVEAIQSRKGGEEEQAAPVTETQYQDENGNVITEAEYNRRLAEQQAAEKAAAEEAAKPKEPIYQDANGKQITKAEYEALLAAMKNQGVTTPPSTSTSGSVTVIKLPPLPPTTPVVGPGGKPPTPLIPQPEVLYFDADGKQITGLQFNQLMSAMPGATPERRSTAHGWAYKVPSAPAPAQATVTPIQATTTGQANPVTYSPSGGSSASDYTLPPAYTPPVQAQTQTYATEAAPAPAPGKVNPALAVGTLVAVPLLFMMTGGK